MILETEDLGKVLLKHAQDIGMLPNTGCVEASVLRRISEVDFRAGEPAVRECQTAM